MQAEINRLTFARVIAPAGEEDAAAALAADQTKLDSLQTEIAPLQTEINQLSRQFWVKKKEIQTNGYDLSASRYRQVEQDEAYYEQPQVTMTRLLQLEQVMGAEVRELQGLML
jgi:type I restriction enzyme M protein